MIHVPIEAFTNPTALVVERMEFKEFYREKEGIDPADFPTGLTMYHWYVAYMGWLFLKMQPPADAAHRQPVAVPNELKPLCDLDTNRGFLVMTGTVAMVLDLSGMDQSAREFVAHAHHVAYDTGHLHMLAYDFVHSISSIDVIREERNRR